MKLNGYVIYFIEKGTEKVEQWENETLLGAVEGFNMHREDEELGEVEITKVVKIY